MLKIITKSAHNALLYQIEDLKKKLESANENIESYKEDLEQSELHSKTFRERLFDWKEKYEVGKKINDEIFHELVEKNQTILAREKEVDRLKDYRDKLDVSNDFLNTELRAQLKIKKDLIAENHRLVNLLQVKCDEVKTLEKKVKEVEAITQYKDVLSVIEAHALNAQAETTTKHTFKKASVQKHLQSILEIIESNT